MTSAPNNMPNVIPWRLVYVQLIVSRTTRMTAVSPGAIFSSGLNASPDSGVSVPIKSFSFKAGYRDPPQNSHPESVIRSNPVSRVYREVISLPIFHFVYSYCNGRMRVLIQGKPGVIETKIGNPDNSMAVRTTELSVPRCVSKGSCRLTNIRIFSSAALMTGTCPSFEVENFPCISRS